MRQRKPKTEWRFAATVWNQTNGDVERAYRDISEDELQAVRDEFADEPWCAVVIDREWEAEVE